MRQIASRPAVLIVVVCVLGALAGPGYPSAMGQEGWPALNARVEVQWIDQETCWYRRELPDGESEYVLINAATGTRSVLFDHTRLAEQLTVRLGHPVEATRLPMTSVEVDETAIRFSLRGGAALLLMDRGSGGVGEATDEQLARVRQRLVADPGPSRDGGGETTLVVENATEKQVRLVWIDGAGKRRDYGTAAPGVTREQHTFAGHSWLFIGEDDAPLGGIRAGRRTTFVRLDGTMPQVRSPRERIERRRAHESPDGQWVAFVRDRNVWVRRVESGEERALSSDGNEADGYEPQFFWSPDSARLVAMKKKRGDERLVYYVESSPRDQLQPKLHSYPYLKPGDRISQSFPHLFDVAAGCEIEIDHVLFDNPWSITEVRWDADASRFTFIYNQRGHQAVRVVAVDGHTGAASAIIDEQCATFFDYSNKLYKYDVPNTGEIIWMSERSGWNHLYLIDNASGVASPITHGEWVVRGVDHVDPDTRQIWFRAMGIVPGQDPYYVHHARVNFDGSGLTPLTQGDGTHVISQSPGGKYLVDEYSRVDQPPVTELRRSADGSLVTTIERATLVNASTVPYRMRTRFAAKGRDGQTDIHGMIVWPRDFDESKQYPVVESIYAGPHGAHVPKAFSAKLDTRQEIADLGFIVVSIDGMGTNWRSKAFHDVCWKNIADAGFPDRIGWMRAAAEVHPQMDLSRVGIYGGSAGGQNAMRALIDHHDFYKVAVADCGCHDNRMDKIWWNEAWMGASVGPEYERSSNVAQAGRLKGDLLLIVGEMDENVDPASTMQVVDALIKADKDFDMLVVAGAGHGAAETPYGRKRRARFLVEHLLEDRVKPR